MKVCFSKTFTMGLKACFDVGLNISSPKHVPRMRVLTFGPRWNFTDYEGANPSNSIRFVLGVASHV